MRSRLGRVPWGGGRQEGEGFLQVFGVAADPADLQSGSDVLLQAAELLGHVLAEPVGHLAVPPRDHNLHVNLLN